MATTSELEKTVKDIVNEAFDLRDGKTVPTTESLGLANSGINLNATMLYADLADSTELAIYDRKMTAKIYKAFLACASRLIKDTGGEIRSFDGDRVMGVFIGDYKNTSATKCALQINYAFQKIIKPAFEAKYEAIRNGTIKLAHCVGVDTSEVLVVRGGIRKDNDLLWVGRAPNIAAKLSSIRDGSYYTYISDTVYNQLNSESKVDKNGKNMWEPRTWAAVKGVSSIYRSNYWWSV